MGSVELKLKSKMFDSLTPREVYEILKARSEIFMLEQNIICQDMDDEDYKSRHCFFEKDGRVVAYLRAYPAKEKDTVQIGRVLTLCHGNGMGRELVEKSLEDLKKHFGCKKITLHSQKQAEGFYKKFGFKTVSDEFYEEGVLHVTMELEI